MSLARRIERGDALEEDVLRDLETFSGVLAKQIDAGTHVYWQGDDNHVRGGYHSVHREADAGQIVDVLERQQVEELVECLHRAARRRPRLCQPAEGGLGEPNAGAAAEEARRVEQRVVMRADVEPQFAERGRRDNAECDGVWRGVEHGISHFGVSGSGPGQAGVRPPRVFFWSRGARPLVAALTRKSRCRGTHRRPPITVAVRA